VVVPYSKYHVVERPCGSTEPCRSAVVAATFRAAVVRATGGKAVLKA
jgi:hypothetical protein